MTLLAGLDYTVRKFFRQIISTPSRWMQPPFYQVHHRKVTPHKPMEEYILNLHMHTPYSDGTGNHAAIAQAAIQAGIDIVIVTDHNVWVDGLEGYYNQDKTRVLLLVGEEIHDQTREPQKNHMMIFGAEREMATYAKEPQRLIDMANEIGGLTFLAHLHDPEAKEFNEADLSWVDWEVRGYTGIELWNAMSEFKGLLKNKLVAIYYAFNPERVAHGPYPQALQKWDELTQTGQRVVAVGGSDAHAMNASLGPIKRVLFPYEFHFRAINTHIFTEQALTGDLASDKAIVLAALRKGHAFVAYDLSAPTRGFKFTAQGMGKSVWMGDEIRCQYGVTLQIKLPQRAECRLIRNGETIETWDDREIASYTATQPGVFRVEAYLDYHGKSRGWIFSNPIYVR